MLMQAIEIYRSHFTPSTTHAMPYVILGVNCVAADTDDEARFLATSGRQSFLNLRRGMPTPLPPPNRAFESEVVPFGAVPLNEAQSIAMVGSAATVRAGMEQFVEQTGADELMVVSHIYDHAARLRSYELCAGQASKVGG
jgi:alkanesulfonate monooxygenase SsuD/methylene tetrahydromethanopterin reductase-like flavin-dependent oxidoreductase (luciferase family)